MLRRTRNNTWFKRGREDFPTMGSCLHCKPENPPLEFGQNESEAKLCESKLNLGE
jgi:hypothetical protein